MTLGTQPSSGKSILTAGIVFFAAIMLAFVAVFQILQGLVAVFDDEFYVIAAGYTFDLDTTAWGWVHIALGIIGLVIAVGLFSGALWARVAAVILATLSAIANFLWIPYYPVWAIVVIVADVLVIWAVTRYDPDDVVV
ncbi:MAG: hypothetical protein ABWX74_10440 [Aeromicrobium sp.]